MEEHGATAPGTRRDQDIALDMMKFIAVTTGYGRGQHLADRGIPVSRRIESRGLRQAPARPVWAVPDGGAGQE